MIIADVLFAVATFCAGEMKNTTSLYKQDCPYYFIGATLKNHPFSVYGLIEPDTLSNWTNAYYEAYFDNCGRVVVLRKLFCDSEMWKVTYLYDESGVLKVVEGEKGTGN